MKTYEEFITEAKREVHKPDGHDAAKHGPMVRVKAPTLEQDDMSQLSKLGYSFWDKDGNQIRLAKNSSKIDGIAIGNNTGKSSKEDFDDFGIKRK